MLVKFQLNESLSQFKKKIEQEMMLCLVESLLRCQYLMPYIPYTDVWSQKVWP